MPTPDEEVVDRVAVTKQMHLCVDFASKIGSLMAEALDAKVEEGPLAVVDMSELPIAAVVKEVFPHIPLSDNRLKWLLDIIAETAVKAIIDNGLATCHVWEMAHKFDHIFYDSDIPHHRS